MGLHLGLTALLVLTLQALNGVRPQDDLSFLLPKILNTSLFNSLNADINILDTNTNIAKQDNTINTDTTTQVVPMSNSSGGVGNATLSDSPSNGTVGKFVTASPDIPLSTTNMSYATSGSNSTSLPEKTNATISSPRNTSTESWASNGTADASNGTAAVAPESHNNTQPNSSSASNTTVTNSTSISNSTTTAANYTSTSNSTSNSTVARSTTTTTTTTTVATSTSIANVTAETKASGNNTDKSGKTGVPTVNKKARNSHAWGAILGTALAVGFVGFIIYLLLKRKNGRQFSHRKLVEDMPSDPVLRLDNSEPLDLKFDGLAYYNPGLQGDHIQMTNFPQGHLH